jgi:hypothetical protein
MRIGSRIFFPGLFIMLSGAPVSRAQKVLPPAEAAQAEGTGKSVTVEFVVKSSHALVPDGQSYRLFSEPPFKDQKAFVVHFAAKKARDRLGVKDLAKHFAGKRIRVTGKVKKVILSSIPQTRPGIWVDDPRMITIIPKNK